MHCRFSHTHSVPQYLFILCLVRLYGMVRDVFIGRTMVCRNASTVAVCAGVGWSLQSL
jgi:hypothetical protein